MSGAGVKGWDRTGGVAQDRRWFPAGYDPERDEWTFARTTNAALAAQPFLDARWDRKGVSQARVKTSALLESLPASGMPHLNFIWHTGFCCSTLMAQVLNSGAKSLGLSEPEILPRIAFGARANREADMAPVKQLAFQLLARSPEEAASITIKPSPAANLLLPNAIDGTHGKMLFLYSDCRSFLLSIRKLGAEGVRYVRELFGLLMADGYAPDARAASELELAALVWHMHIAQMRAHWPGAARAASLDCDAFLADMPGVMTKIAAFLEIDLHAEDFQAMAEQGKFSRNAKQPDSAHDPNARRREHGALAEQLGNDLNRVVRWSYDLFPGTPRSALLDDPLVKIEKAYVP